jgi:hypothetical protein
VDAPGRDHEGGVFDRGEDILIVLFPDRVCDRQEALRVGRTIGEDVRDLDGAVAPPAGVAAAPGYGGVEVGFVGGGGVEHDKSGFVGGIAPFPV